MSKMLEVFENLTEVDRSLHQHLPYRIPMDQVRCHLHYNVEGHGRPLISKYILLYKKLRSILRIESFLAFWDFEYSKFLDSFSAFLFQIKRQTKRKNRFIAENK